MSRTVPTHTRLSQRVLKIPMTSHVFNRAIWIQRCIRNNPIVKVPGYFWIEKGDPLFEFIILSPHPIDVLGLFPTAKTNLIEIKSPASGVVLHNLHSFGDRKDNARDYCVAPAILLPEGNAEPVPVSTIFNDLCDFCWQHRRTMYFRQSELSSQYDETSLKKAFDEQLSREYVYQNVLPRYRDNIDDAIQRNPELRPFLQHY